MKLIRYVVPAFALTKTKPLSLYTPSKLDPSTVHGITKLSDLTPAEFRSHVYIFGQCLRLKWFFMQITDFSGRNRRWSLFRSQPTNGHENHVTCRCIVVSEGFSDGRYMTFLPSPSPHLSGHLVEGFWWMMGLIDVMLLN